MYSILPPWWTLSVNIYDCWEGLKVCHTWSIQLLDQSMTTIHIHQDEDHKYEIHEFGVSIHLRASCQDNDNYSENIGWLWGLPSQVATIWPFKCCKHFHWLEKNELLTWIKFNLTQIPLVLSHPTSIIQLQKHLNVVKSLVVIHLSPNEFMSAWVCKNSNVFGEINFSVLGRIWLFARHNFSHLSKWEQVH